MLPPPIPCRRECCLLFVLITFCSYFSCSTENIMSLFVQVPSSLHMLTEGTMSYLFFELYAQRNTQSRNALHRCLEYMNEQLCHKGFSHTAQKSVPCNGFYLLILVLLETTENTTNSLSHECLSNLKTPIRSFSVFLL